MTTLRTPATARMNLNVTALSERDASTDFRDAVFTKEMKALLKDPQFTLLHSDILVATYIKPNKTPGGIIIPQKSVDEDRWQGKAGLVLKLGESAFQHGPFGVDYKGTIPKVGDYVTFHTSEAREIGLLGFSCRHIESSLVRMIVPNPDVIF